MADLDRPGADGGSTIDERDGTLRKEVGASYEGVPLGTAWDVGVARWREELRGRPRKEEIPLDSLNSRCGYLQRAMNTPELGGPRQFPGSTVIHMELAEENSALESKL